MEEDARTAFWSEARRYIEDLALFEEAHFIVPQESAESVRSLPQERSTSVPVPTSTPSSSVAEPESLEAFRQSICDCTRCGLAATRTQFVFGSGNQNAGIMFVGEAPGAEEDRSGQPFVGAAGQLLTKIIEAMGLSRESVYICNILKCRPPNNRDPQPDEIAQCEPYLKRQIELVRPRVLCTLGRFAAQTLLRSDQSMGRLREGTHHYEGIPLVATYHPAALLRNPQWKKPTWEDVKKVRRFFDGVEL
jgi:uracil-DNA glycosylase family 4